MTFDRKFVVQVDQNTPSKVAKSPGALALEKNYAAQIEIRALLTEVSSRALGGMTLKASDKLKLSFAVFPEVLRKAFAPYQKEMQEQNKTTWSFYRSKMADTSTFVVGRSLARPWQAQLGRAPAEQVPRTSETST